MRGRAHNTASTEEEHMAISKSRRATLGAMVATAALALAGGAQAQAKEDIVIGGSIPMSPAWASTPASRTT
jgi:hypothetical protein